MSRGTYERSEFVTVRTTPAISTEIELYGGMENLLNMSEFFILVY